MTALVLDWDPAKASGNAAKHGVTFENAASVFLDPLSVSIYDAESSVGEDRWITLGLARTGSLLVVVHTWLDDEVGHVFARVISARRATHREARQYREGS